MFGLGTIFTLFFVTLGPLKLLGPYAQQTHELEPAALRAISIRVFIVGLVSIIVGGSVGSALAGNWHISVPAILISTGLIFFLVAIRLVMAEYSPVPSAPPRPLPPEPMAAALRLTFPLIVTPYGIAAVIALLTMAEDSGRTLAIYIILVVIMVMNLLFMIYIRQIMRGAVLLILQVVGSVLGVLQVALAVEILIRGSQHLKIFSSL
jgi:multiple antibiotic resistance protein